MPRKATPAAPPKRGRGQPRKYPRDAKAREWYATDAEYTALQQTAAREGTSAAELVRRRVLGQ